MKRQFGFTKLSYLSFFKKSESQIPSYRNEFEQFSREFDP